MKATYLLLFAAVSLIVRPAAAFDEGIVKGKNVNVRAQAFLNSEVVTQLQQGARVKIIETVNATRPSGKYTRWYKIVLPSNTPVWVHGKYLVDGKVTATRLNVRSGPGEKFSVIGRVSKDARVTEIRRMDPWVEIESSEATHGFVATSLLQVESTGPTPPSVVSASTPVATPPPTPVVSYPIAPIASPTTVDLITPEATPIAAAPITPISAAAPPSAIPGGSSSTIFSEIAVGPAVPNPGVQTIETETLVTSGGTPRVEPNPLLAVPVDEPAAAETAVSYRVVDPDKPRGTIVGNWWRGVFSGKKKNAKSAAVTPDESAPGQEKFHHAPAETGPPAVRNVTREGKVVRAWNIQAPSDWALQEIYTGRVINYLWTTHTNIPWKELNGRIIRVTGEEAIERRWQRTPVLHIQTLKTIDAEGDE